MATSKFKNEHPRRVLAKPESPSDQPARESSRKPAKDKMTDVTVKLPQRLLDKLDRLVKRESGIAKAGRSTVLRWILDRFEE